VVGHAVGSATGELPRLLAGDVSAVRALLAFSSDEVADASANVQLTVTPEAAIVVLECLARDESQATDVLWWAEIVRYGHVAGNCRRWKRLDIHYQADFEHEIVEVVGRLTELGDLVHGELRAGEIEESLTSLAPQVINEALITRGSLNVRGCQPIAD
jgi:hypothetical protein